MRDTSRAVQYLSKHSLKKRFKRNIRFKKEACQIFPFLPQCCFLISNIDGAERRTLYFFTS